MPNYVYHCDNCGNGGEMIRKIAERDNPIACGVCGERMRRLAIQPTVQGRPLTEFRLIDSKGKKHDVGGKRREG